LNWRRYVGAVAGSQLLAATAAAASAAATEPASLAERIDLTRITVLQADYARAAAERDARDLAAYEREVLAMLEDEVLPYARASPAGPGAPDAGTGSGAATARTEAAPAVAVDEEEVGAAALEAHVVDLAKEFASLEGRNDRASLEAKATILGGLQAVSERAHFSSSPLPPSDEDRQQLGEERRARKEAEKLP
jgi:hypothetical protein